MSAQPIHMQVNSSQLLKQHRERQERIARLSRLPVLGEDAVSHVWAWRERQWGLYGAKPRADDHVRAYRLAKRPVPAATIISAVAGHFDICPADILSTCRMHPYVRPRQVAMYLYRTLSGRSFPEIGRRFGRDHTTALSNCRKIARMIAEGHPIAQDVEALRQKLMRDRA